MTHNYIFARHWGVGAGFQGYTHAPLQVDYTQFIPAVYADVRLYIRPEKANQFFSFLDLGIDFYKPGLRYHSRNTNIVYNVPHNNGVYSGLGFGYFHKLTRNGSGLYTSLKMVMNWSKISGYNNQTHRQEVSLLTGNGTVILSLGFRF